MTYLEKARKLDPSVDVTSAYLDAAFGRARMDADYTWAEYIDVAREYVLEGDADPTTTLSTTYYVGRATSGEEDHATVKPFLEKSREKMANADEELSPGLVQAIELQALMVLDEDMDAAVDYKRAHMADGWMEDADQLNAFAWWCFENGVNLEEAQKLALKGVELADAGTQRAMVLDTAAEICNALGNCDEAIALIKLALEEEPGNEYYGEQLAKFEEAAAEE
jgi:hypothetical protein